MSNHGKKHSSDGDHGDRNREMDPSKPTTTAIATTAIGALPEELLLRVFHTLPWRDRVRGVEGVCRYWRQLVLAHGWDDVRFDEYGSHGFVKPWEQRTTAYEDHTPWRVPLLSRIGPRLVSLHLSSGCNEPTEQRCELLRADIAKCPAVRHLGLHSKCLDPPTIAYIANAYAPKLKSLLLDSCSPSLYEYDRLRRVNVDWAYVWALNGALGAFTALEYLNLSESGEALRGLRFPASMANLRRLELGCRMDERPTGVLSEANVRVLASLPTLSSLGLYPDYRFTANFTFLRHFTRLQHLHVDLSVSSVGGFVEAMPQLARSLRALEVWFEEDTSNWPRTPTAGNTLSHLVPAMAAHLSKLEHLGLHSSINEESEELDGELLKCLRQLGYSSTPLRSLNITLKAGEDWGWLVGMRHLEYLNLSYTPPLATLCAIIEGFKGLRYLAPGWRYDPTTEEQAQLIAAATKTYTTSIDGTGGAGYGEEEEQGAKLPMPLHVRVETVSTIDNYSRAAGSRRLRFSKEFFSSPVADRYAFGCLSEGKPPWLVR